MVGAEKVTDLQEPPSDDLAVCIILNEILLVITQVVVHLVYFQSCLLSNTMLFGDNGLRKDILHFLSEKHAVFAEGLYFGIPVKIFGSELQTIFIFQLTMLSGKSCQCDH